MVNNEAPCIIMKVPYLLMYKSHFSYPEINAKMECVLYAHTKREGTILHNLGGNKILLFFNINNEYMSNKQMY